MLCITVYGLASQSKKALSDLETRIVAAVMNNDPWYNNSNVLILTPDEVLPASDFRQRIIALVALPQSAEWAHRARLLKAIGLALDQFANQEMPKCSVVWVSPTVPLDPNDHWHNERFEYVGAE